MLSEALPDKPPAMAQLSALPGIAGLWPPAHTRQEARFGEGGEETRLVQGCTSTFPCSQAPSSAHPFQHPLTWPFLHTDPTPKQGTLLRKPTPAIPSTGVAPSPPPPNLFLLSSLNHNQSMRPPAPNAISAAAGPHRGLVWTLLLFTAGHISAQTLGPFC